MKACNQCGKCCLKYGGSGLSVSADEIDSWELYRPDIYQYVSQGEIWVDPETGEFLERCPWLRKAPDKTLYTCDIYHDRPEDCRHYPVTLEEMVRDECEMIEVQDLAKPKQAQKSLDHLMAESRPPYLS